MEFHKDKRKTLFGDCLQNHIYNYKFSGLSRCYTFFLYRPTLIQTGSGK